MIVDYLRSCYTTQARMYPSAPGRRSTIRWYWAAPGAQRLPVPTVFTSNNWIDASERPGTDLGEVHGATRTWNNGSIARRPPGTSFHGDPGDYAGGISPGNTYPRLPSGLLVECVVAAVPVGGLVLGGEAAVWPRSPFLWDPYCGITGFPPHIDVERFPVGDNNLPLTFHPPMILEPSIEPTCYRMYFTGGTNPATGTVFPDGVARLVEGTSGWVINLRFNGSGGEEGGGGETSIEAQIHTCSPWVWTFWVFILDPADPSVLITGLRLTL